MEFILSLIMNKYVIIGLIIATMVATGIFYISGLKNNIVKLEASNKVLTSDLQVSQASVKTLQNSVTDQNAAIDKLKTDADARVIAHQAEIVKAQTISAGYKKQAKDLENLKIPVGKQSCDAANDLINQEIRNGK